MVIGNINNVNLSTPIGVNSNNADISGSVASHNAANTVSFKGVNKYAIKRQARYFLRWISKNFSSPQQRAVLGVTALCTQPFIDLYNSHIKKEDKPVTVAKTISKIVVGTTAGILMRHYAIKIAKNFTKSVNCGKYSQCLLPQEIVVQLAKNPKAVPETHLANYRNGLGTFIGTMCGLFTNFLIDAPLSRKLTNFLHEKVFMKEKAHEK